MLKEFLHHLFFPGKNSLYINYWREELDTHENPKICCIPVDHDFIKTFKMKIVEGGIFQTKFPGCERRFHYQSGGQKEFGWESSVGKRFKLAH